jgi:hypothetical protein
VPFWRRDEPAHKRLARALPSGSVAGPLDPLEQTAFDVPAIHGGSRPRRWDTVITVDAPGLPGDAVHFLALVDGTLIVDEDVPDDSLTPVADAVEQQLELPYRAEGIRRGETVWAVAGKEVEVAEINEDVEGNLVELSVNEGEKTTLVDGERAFGSLAGFERLAEGHDAFALRAERIDGTLWEVEVSPL